MTLAGCIPQMSSVAESLVPRAVHCSPLMVLVRLFDKDDSRHARSMVESMLSHAWGPYGTQAITGGDAHCAWGLLLPDQYGPLTVWSIFQREKELCIVEGDLYEDPPGITLVPGENPGLAESVAKQFRRGSYRPTDCLNGVFSGFYWNRDSTLCAFGDHTGTRTVYWHGDLRSFVVSGNLWSFRGCTGLNRQWDTMALSQMLTLGIPLAGRTWLEGVRLLQRGRVIQVYPDGRCIQECVVSPVQRETCSLKESVSLLREGLDQTTKDLSRRSMSRIGLGLSGGLDSRILLASLSSQQLPHKCFTFLGSQEADDHSIAGQAASLVGSLHETIALDKPGRGNVRDYRLVNEGESGSAGFLDMAAYASQDVNLLMIGYPADVLAGAPVGPFQPLRIKSKQELAGNMLRVSLTLFSQEALRKLLNDSFRVPWQDILDEWNASFVEINQGHLMDVYLDHMLDYRLQRRTRPRIEQIRWFCQPLYPFMDRRVYSVYRKIPLSHLEGERAHCALLESYGTGLETLPSAQRRFTRVPLKYEYPLRHVIHMGRVVKASWIPTLKHHWQTIRSLMRGQHVGIYPPLGHELAQLMESPIVNQPAVEKLLHDVNRGLFWNLNAVRQLVNVQVIQSFLFDDGLKAPGDLEMLPATRAIQCVPYHPCSETDR